MINSLQPDAALLYPLKTLEKPKGFLMFSAVIEKQHCNGLIVFKTFLKSMRTAPVNPSSI